MPGEMNWEDMNWLFTDFTDTGLIYHGTRPENLPGIFADGLVPGKITDPTERHETIYEAHYRHRPDWIPRWVDPRHCIFGYTNRRRQGNLNPVSGGKLNGVSLGIQATNQIRKRTWMGYSGFSDLVYCPKEAGYFDTPERREYFEQTLEPACSEAYWRTSLEFEEHLKVRIDQLLPMQNYLELLICLDFIPSELLSIQAFRVKAGCSIREVLCSEIPGIFEEIESKFRKGSDPERCLKEVISYAAGELETAGA